MTATAIGVSWRPIWKDFKGEQKPTITLEITEISSPVLRLVNPTGKVARQIRVVIGLWNIDAANNARQFLQIPALTLDFVSPFGGSIPQNVFQYVDKSLRYGDRLFGWVLVNCADCESGRAYLVFMRWHEGGWYSEAIGQPSDTINLPEGFERMTLEEYAKKTVDTLPQGLRNIIR
jgi:hypothetical protein